MRYTWIKVTVPPGTEKVVDFVTSTTEQPKRLDTLYVYKDTNVQFRAYVERERIFDMHGNVVPSNHPYFTLDMQLPIGQTLKVGGYNESAGTLDVYFGLSFEVTS